MESGLAAAQSMSHCMLFTATSTSEMTFCISIFFSLISVRARCSTSCRMPLRVNMYCPTDITSIMTAATIRSIILLRACSLSHPCISFLLIDNVIYCYIVIIVKCKYTFFFSIVGVKNQKKSFSFTQNNALLPNGRAALFDSTRYQLRYFLYIYIIYFFLYTVYEKYMGSVWEGYVVGRSGAGWAFGGR